MWREESEEENLSKQGYKPKNRGKMDTSKSLQFYSTNLGKSLHAEAFQQKRGQIQRWEKLLLLQQVCSSPGPGYVRQIESDRYFPGVWQEKRQKGRRQGRRR